MADGTFARWRALGNKLLPNNKIISHTPKALKSGKTK